MFVISMLVLMPLVFAFDTQITIKTNPSNDVTVRVLNPNTGKTLGDGLFLSQSPDENGNIIIDYSTHFDKVHISTFIEKTKSTRFFRDLKTGGVVIIDLTNSDSEAVVKSKIVAGIVEDEAEEPVEEGEELVEEVVEESEEPVEEKSEEVVGTGSVIRNSGVSKSVYYLVGGVIGTLVLVFLIHFVRKFKIVQKT